MHSPCSDVDTHAGTAAAFTTPRSCGAVNSAFKHAPAVAAACRQARAPGTAFSAMRTDARSSNVALNRPRLGPAASVVHQVMAFCKLDLAAPPASSADKTLKSGDAQPVRAKEGTVCHGSPITSWLTLSVNSCPEVLSSNSIKSALLQPPVWH